jgi:hypothetical protein
LYLGPDGRELTISEWDELFARRREDMSSDSWWRRETVISDQLRVSTVWLGLNHNFGDGPPLYWETMIFFATTPDDIYPDHHPGRDQWRYSSRQAALDDHERIVTALRAGITPD